MPKTTLTPAGGHLRSILPTSRRASKQVPLDDVDGTAYKSSMGHAVGSESHEPSTASAAVTVEGASTLTMADSLFEKYGHDIMSQAVRVGTFDTAAARGHAADAVAYSLKAYTAQRNKAAKLARAKVSANTLADMLENKSTLNFVQMMRIMDSIDPEDLRLLTTRAQA